MTRSFACGDADAHGRGQAVRHVLLQLLCDVDSIFVAFRNALDSAAQHPRFHALLDSSEEPTIDVGGNVIPQRQLLSVPKELNTGLRVGVGSALERILQVRITRCR